jgi:dUTP pyrophosphatase
MIALIKKLRDKIISPRKAPKVLIKKLCDGVILPRKQTPGAVGYDVYLPCDVNITKTRNVIPLGFALELPPMLEAKIEPRSGFSAKGIEGHKLQTYTLDKYASAAPESERFDADVLVGKIDPDYRGEVCVMIHSNDCRAFQIKKGTRIAQMTFYNVVEIDFSETEHLSETERGDGGLGHTGIGL